VGIEVGQTLDKYELLEKVGQGGMAVVYRGRDTSLKREVAVKVLHHHLADHEEARDRFEREAQAVAKLRHENILEIFDYSGKDDGAAYIVTEFIAGQTLKQFITDHGIKYPEIGAMIAVQVCRALGHAHSLGVLHRDVKPENIMIRNDGVVKLTDFGIAQMLDTHRLTVTGQLLGSPAYMSPEHVEGKQLDFRTDVFAVGIVLYQLVTGELPFRGKNPHEILKKIAEGRYPDPQQQQPLVGNRLAAILRKALAREKDDRYADIGQMELALEAYLAQCGLADFPGELGRFFRSPVSYEMALKPRLAAALTTAGRAALVDDRNTTLELFNRVLTIDPDNAEVIAEIERLSRRARGVRLLALFGAVVLIGGGALWIRSRAGGELPLAVAPSAVAAADGGAAVIAPGPLDAGVAPLAAVADAAAAEVEPSDAGPRGTDSGGNGGGSRPPAGRPDAGPRSPGGQDAARPAVRRAVTLVVTPRNSEVSLDGGASWRRLGGARETLELGPERATLRFRNPSCCSEGDAVVEAGTGPTQLQVDLPYLPGSVTPRCDRDGVTATIDGRPWQLGSAATIPITSVTGREKVLVRFTDGAEYRDEQAADVRYAQSLDVTCAE
jgi:eukaryotic-like serine/threonine-protein kinase